MACATRSRSAPLRSLAAPVRRGRPVSQRRVKRASCAASAESSSSSARPTFSGKFGQWTLTEEDEREVFLYRAALSLSSFSFAAGSAAFLALGESAGAPLEWAYLGGAVGLGGALGLVHMYAADIKRVILALYALGAVGSVVAKLALVGGDGMPLPVWVGEHPAAIWLVGPMFASMTGLAIKEGLCYGKAEAALIAVLTPTILLGHLTGLAGDGVEAGLLAVWAGCVATFGARKWTQPVEADLGDKSIFDFLALSEEEQRAKLASLGITNEE